jgi:hypothetical protein
MLIIRVTWMTTAPQLAVFHSLKRTYLLEIHATIPCSNVDDRSAIHGGN